MSDLLPNHIAGILILELDALESLSNDLARFARFCDDEKTAFAHTNRILQKLALSLIPPGNAVTYFKNLQEYVAGRVVMFQREKDRQSVESVVADKVVPWADFVTSEDEEESLSDGDSPEVLVTDPKQFTPGFATAERVDLDTIDIEEQRRILAELTEDGATTPTF